MFMLDPATGKKVLATRKRRGDIRGCHGKNNLAWKHHGDGFEALVCQQCGREHTTRVRCLRCDELKEDKPCRKCSAGPGEDVGGARPIDAEEVLACKGNDGLCCRCAGDRAREEG